MRPIRLERDELLKPLELANLIAESIFPRPHQRNAIDFFVGKKFSIDGSSPQLSEKSEASDSSDQAPLYESKLNSLDMDHIRLILRDYKDLSSRSPSAYWAKFRGAWDSHPNKPNWVPILSLGDEDPHEEERLSIRRRHYEEIQRRIHSGSMRLVDKNRVPVRHLTAGDYIKSSDAADYIVECDIDVYWHDGGRLGVSRQNVDVVENSPGDSRLSDMLHDDGGMMPRGDQGIKSNLYYAVDEAVAELRSQSSIGKVMEKLKIFASNNRHGIQDVGPCERPDNVGMCVMWVDANNMIKETNKDALGLVLWRARVRYGLAKKRKPK